MSASASKNMKSLLRKRSRHVYSWHHGSFYLSMQTIDPESEQQSVAAHLHWWCYIKIVDVCPTSHFTRTARHSSMRR